ncbi:MAG: hypothetical protein IH846_16825, partial [Acidobacteria bacterium]|nr:hypothetical protein [Acidobacteriota bacterium]
QVMTDRDTGRARGFAFVELADDEQAAKAITELNGKELDGRALNVNEARPKPERSGPRGGGGGGGGVAVVAVAATNRANRAGRRQPYFLRGRFLSPSIPFRESGITANWSCRFIVATRRGRPRWKIILTPDFWLLTSYQYPSHTFFH